jgi:hypothetical protein
MSQRLDGARGRQGPEQPVLVLFDRRGHVEAREDDGGGVGRGQGRVRARGGAERMRPDRGPARQEEPRGVGEAGGGRRALAVEVMRDRLEGVVAMAAGAVQGCLPGLRCRRLSGRHDKPRVIARGHAVRLDEAAPRLLPRGRGRGARLIDARTGGRRRARGVRHSGPLRAETARRRHARGSLAAEPGMAREAAHPIPLPSLGKHREDCWGGALTSAADQARGRGPMAPARGEEAAHAHRLCRARRPLPRSKEGGQPGGRGPCQTQPRQLAITLGGMVREGQFRLALGRGFRLSAVPDKRGRGLGRAGHAVVDARLGTPVEVRAGHLRCEPGKGRSTRHVLGRIERYAFHTQRKHGSIPAAVRIIAVRIAGGNVVDTLGAEVPERRGTRRRVALVTHGGSHALCPADLTVDTP